MAARIRCVIVDDERLARKRLRQLLRDEPDVQVLQEFADGPSAVAGIPRLAADLLFLDVQMPEMDGFETLRALDRDRPPAVVFCTAYDQYAIKAFDVHAIDYLLKPFDDDRVRQTIARVRAHGSADAPALREQMSRLIERLERRETYLERLAIRTDGTIVFVRTADIDYAEAAGNYVRLRAARTTHLMHETLTNLAERLDPSRFLRIHRSTIVNVDRIAAIQPMFHGDAVAVLRDGTRLPVSRTYRAAVEKLFET
ncbi:MAG: response regulator transcription factor [Cytophagaceae bacterium]|nr:response regulator transcription factor [Gemmatimonadaceae bacterium]